MSIYFFSEEVSYKVKRKSVIKALIKKVVLEENRRLGGISIIVTSDKYLLEVNKKYLNHHYFTDVITFNYNEGSTICGDIFISLDTIEKNSELYQVTLDNELLRVIIHGVLHLLGYNDKGSEEQMLMKEKENHYLKLI